MASRSIYCSVLLIISMFFLRQKNIYASAQLTAKFYESTCPKALNTIRIGVNNAVIKEHRMGASLLRLHFHDCFVNGCDASVLLDDTSSLKGEKTAEPNLDSLRGFEIIDSIKTQLEGICPGVVSCADILSVAARDSVVLLGGPSWEVQLGRRDSLSASLSAVNSNIPFFTMDLAELISSFSSKGFTSKEMVALSGAHTIGQAKCMNFRDRLYNETTTIQSSLATSLKSKCPTRGSNDSLSALDTTSQFIFDNAYYKNLIDNKGLLHSDQQLFSGGSTDVHVTTYSKNPTTFYADFASAIVKMGNLSPLTGTNGQIRTNCRKLN